MGPESLVFLIPIVAILGGISLGGFKEWLKFKSKQDRLGNSTHELEATVGRLRDALETSEAERERLTRRVQNIETIVTSQDWDALGDGAPSSLTEASLEAENLEAERAGDAEKTARLARRLHT